MSDLNIVDNETNITDPFKHFKKLLKKGEGGGSNNLDGLETVNSETMAEPDLSEPTIKDRLEFTGGELHRIIKDFLGDKPELYEIADKIVSDGGEALRILDAEDDRELNRNKTKTIGALETIVRLDGSRPSFMIQNGEINRATSPLGTWANTLDTSNNSLIEAISCVGRIDIPWVPGGFIGTGFLIQENLILTNRHVLQLAARQDADGNWKVSNEAIIDFGHEFRGIQSQNRRQLKRVMFCGPDKIDLNASVDHKKLDLALIELEPATAVNRPSKVLSVDKAPDWTDSEPTIFTIGYPGKPPQDAYSPILIEQLFQSTFGYKRLAPGLIMPSGQNVQPWTLSHDATTLGGNSGSVVLVAGRETAVAGLHYGGQNAQPRQNWGHILGRVLEQPVEPTDSTTSTAAGETATTAHEALIDLLEELGVSLIDRVTD